MTVNRQIDNIADIYPLVDVQKGMVFHTLKDPKGGVYHNQMVLGLKERAFDSGRFAKALKLMMTKHSILRSGFDLSSFEEPVQIVYKSVEPDLATEDLSHLSHDSKHRHINRFLSQDRTQPFCFDDKNPPWRMRLFVLDPDNICLVWICHHAIVDGWSNAIFLGELQEVYHRLEKEPDYSPPNLKCSYKDFVIRQLAQKKKPDVADFWKNELAGFKRLELGIEQEKYTEASGNQSLRLVFNKSDVQRTRALAAKYNSSAKHVCFGVYILMLSLISYDNDIVVGTVVNNRPVRQDGDLLVGCFLNTVPVRFQVPARITYTDFIRKIEEKMVALKQYDQLPFQEIARHAGNHTSDDNPIFDTLFNYVDYQMYTDAISGDNSGGSDGENQAADQFIQENVTTNTPMDFHIDFGNQEAIIALTIDTGKVSSNTAQRLLNSYRAIFDGLLADPNDIFSKDRIISQDNMRTLLREFNDTTTEFPADKTILDFLENTATRYPNKEAVIFGDNRLTYAELEEMSEKLARRLIEKGTGPARLVAIIMERSIEMMVGIIGILKSSSAYLPIAPGTPEERIRFMINDGHAHLALGDSNLSGAMPEFCDVLDLSQLDWNKMEMAGSLVKPDSLQPAYVIYTSGSTGVPKGVMVQHRSVVNRLNWMQSAYPLTPNDVILQKTPIVFDVSVWELFWWSMSGASVCLLGPGDEKKPDVICNEVENQGITTMHFVPSMLGSFLEYIDSSGDASRLTSLKRVFASGEALKVQHVDSFYQLFQNDGIELVNLYGPTEATVDVSFYNCERNERHGSAGIPIGRPIDNTQLFVLDINMQIQDIGVAGELCIGGVGLASGYLNRVEMTAERFLENPYSPGEKLYRTGDLARFRNDGAVEFLGRLDLQVKIRGFRIELGEIEARLLDVDSIKEAVVIACGSASEDNRVVAYIVSGSADDDHNPEDIARQLQDKLPDYMLPSQYIFLEALPLLINGKVDRKALPQPGNLAISSNYCAPTNELEKALTEIWSGLLGLDQDTIGIDDNFFRLGGHSLTLISLTSRIHKTLGFRIQMSDVFDFPTIRQFVERLNELKRTEFLSVSAVEKKEYYTVSAAQKRLYILQQMDPGSTAYHLPQVAALSGRYHHRMIADTFLQLTRRHESLRTSFHSIRGNPVQKVWDEAVPQFEYYDLFADNGSMDLLPEKIAEFHKPFDLSVAPLFRVLLIRKQEFSYSLLVDMHHIIADGVSLELLIADFKSIFSGNILPSLDIQYKDYAEWQNKLKLDGGLASQEEFWLETFSDHVPVLRLPYDFKRPAIQSFEGDSIEFTLTPQQSAQIQQLTDTNKTTLYMVLIALINILLSRLSGQEDVVVGTPVAGRRHADIEPLIGMFVNTLPLRNFPKEKKSVGSFLTEVKEHTLQAFENQEYPFEDIVDLVDIPRDISRNPLFDVMFTWQELGVSDSRDETETAPPQDTMDQEFIPQQVKFDMTILSKKLGDRIWFEFQYSKRLFKRESIERFVNYFKNIVSQALVDNHAMLGAIEILSPAEKRKILVDFNDTGGDFPESVSLWDMIATQAQRTPNLSALVFEDQWITYRELDSQVEILSRKILELGCNRDSIIGVLTDTSLRAVIAISAIMKSGCAFLPIDAAAPTERVRYMLNDSNAYALLCSETWANRVADISTLPLIDIDSFAFESKQSLEIAENQSERGLAYIMYTSGSTGNPKGVAISHRNIVNQIHGLIGRYSFDSSYRHVLMAPYTFDPSVQQIFMPLGSGGRLTLLSNKVKNDPTRLLDTMVLHKINIFNTVPSLMELLLEINRKDERLKMLESLRLKMIILAGELFSKELLAKLRTYCPGCRLINIYGPTEATINTTFYQIPDEDDVDSVSIGKPLHNYQVYVLNQSMKPVPINVPGELCVSGEGIARGYLNRPELTSQAFVQNPFIPGTTLYRTGDLARWREDGNLVFQGRIDSQIKIRGMRVEAGEVESVLSLHPAIGEAVVLPEKSATRGGALIAYFVPSADIEPTLQDLRDFLMKELPEFMIPARFHIVDRIPLNKNGKIDQKALRKLSHRIESTEEHIPPANEMEATTARIWQVVLELDDVSVHDNFFDLGGNSLDIVKVSHLLGEELAIPVRVMDLFRYTTIRSLCDYLGAEGNENHFDNHEKRQESLDRAQDSLDDALDFFQEDE